MLSVLAAVLAFQQAGLAASFAQANILPPELLPLGGYTERHGRIMSPGGEPLYARALVLRQNGGVYAIVSVETLTIPESLVREVRLRLSPSAHLLMCATHTHCAPDSQMLNDRMTLAIPGIASYKRRWLAWYADHIAATVRAAMAAPTRGIPEIDAESWVVNLNRGRRKGADPDPIATLVGGVGAKPWIFEYAAHGTFYDADENKTREDWPGGVTRVARMALIGPIGDVSPKAPGPENAPAATKIAAFWTEVLAKRRSSKTVVVWRPGQACGWCQTPILLAKPVPHPSFKPHALGQILVSRFAPKSADISALRLGDLAIVGVPGEPSSHLGRDIQEAGLRLGFAKVLVLSHCNGWMGYILGPKDYDAGGYEATLSFYGRDGGSRVVAAAAKALRQLRKLGRGVRSKGR